MKAGKTDEFHLNTCGNGKSTNKRAFKQFQTILARFDGNRELLTESLIVQLSGPFELTFVQTNAVTDV